MGDVYTPYEVGAERVLRRLGKKHQRYGDVVVLRDRLQANIAQTRIYGDNPTRNSERFEILGQLNRICLADLDLAFNDFCGEEEPGPAGPLPEEKEAPGEVGAGVDLRPALQLARRVLKKLEEQAAGYTALSIPAHLAIELEEQRKKVAELEARLGAREGRAGPVSPTGRL